MLTKFKLCITHHWKVKKEGEITFNNKLNVIVGPNGSGKSTILRAIQQCNNCIRKESQKTNYRFFDTEMNNPHATEKKFKGRTGNILKIRAMFSSHGEIMRTVLENFKFNKGDCLLIDEPESGEDIEWVIKIRKALEAMCEQGCQVIVATHHPVFFKNANIIELEDNYITKILKLFKEEI